MKSITLKNVAHGDSVSDVTVQVVPFSTRNNAHVEFAFAYADMLSRAPSTFANLNDAAFGYVKLFVVHKEEDSANPDCPYYHISRDIRAARTLLNDETIQKALNDFFVNA